MYLEAILAAVGVALFSLAGALFFAKNRDFEAIEKYVIPVAVGVFLSLVLIELMPETLEASSWGSVVIAIGFISFYGISYQLHKYFHQRKEDGDENCDQKGAASLILIGDSIHNIADGVILGSAFLIDPSVGIAVAIGLALHEIPQEIVEFGILIRGGFSVVKATWLNLISASSILIGTTITLSLSKYASDYVWIITGLAAGNLLFIAASDLLPRIHGKHKTNSSFWFSLILIISGFVFMAGVLHFSHDRFPHEHTDTDVHAHQ